MAMSRSLAFLLFVLALDFLVEGVPLRGSRHVASEIVSRRQLMEQRVDDDGFDDNGIGDDTVEDFLITSTINPTPKPTFPGDVITSMPTSTITDGGSETAEPSKTEQPTETKAPLAPNVRSLRAFSIRLEGVLADENIFRRDLELFLLTTMKELIPSLQNIILEPAELSFGQRHRSLQQATALGYEGDAILFIDGVEEQSLPTTDDIREAQLNALLRRSEASLQYYLNEFSSQPVTLLQIQIAGFQPVELNGSGVDSSSAAAETQDDGFNMPLLIGIPVGVAILLCVIGGCIYWNNFVKPPPPPPFDPDDIDQNDKSVDDLVDVENKPIKPLAGTPSTTDSEGFRNARSPASENSYGTRESSQDATRSVGSTTSKKSGVVDLRKPAKHARGVESVAEENQPPEDDSTFGGMSLTPTVQSNDEDSMAGYSLEGPDPEPSVGKPDAKRSLIEAIIKERAAARASQTSGAVQNSAVARWMAPQAKARKQRPWSKGGSAARLDALSNPQHDGDEIDSVFVDDDDEEIEVISQSSGQHSGGRGSVMSAASRSYLQYQYAGENHEVAQRADLPLRNSVGPTAPQRIYAPPDDVSDVPSDERTINRTIEQDLRGFTKASSLRSALDGITGTRSPELKSTTMPQDGSWEDNPEMMEAWLRERRRVKQQARSRLQDRS
jgi:hypothetical protein